MASGGHSGNIVADPNPNLTVQLFKQPRGEWVGIRAQTRWRPSAGLGVGSGTLLSVHGEIGRVAMSVVLVRFRKACFGGQLAASGGFLPRLG